MNLRRPSMEMEPLVKWWPQADRVLERRLHEAMADRTGFAYEPELIRQERPAMADTAWTDEERGHVMAFWRFRTDRELAADLCRPVKGVVCERRKLGLRRVRGAVK